MIYFFFRKKEEGLQRPYPDKTVRTSLVCFYVAMMR